MQLFWFCRNDQAYRCGFACAYSTLTYHRVSFHILDILFVPWDFPCQLLQPFACSSTTGAEIKQNIYSLKNLKFIPLHAKQWGEFFYLFQKFTHWYTESTWCDSVTVSASNHQIWAPGHVLWVWVDILFELNWAKRCVRFFFLEPVPSRARTNSNCSVFGCLAGTHLPETVYAVRPQFERI